MEHEKETEDYKFATLTNEQRESLKQAEAETGLVLIAYEYDQSNTEKA